MAKRQNASSDQPEPQPDEPLLPGGFWSEDRYEIDGRPTLLQRSDIKYEIPNDVSPYIARGEGSGYWLETEYNASLILKNQREDDYRYFVVEPHVTDEERMLISFFHEKIKQELPLEEVPIEEVEDEEAFELRIRNELFRLLRRFGFVQPGFFSDDYEHFTSAEEIESDEQATGVTEAFFNFFTNRVFKRHVREANVSKDVSPTEFDVSYEEGLGDAIQDVVPLSHHQVDKILYYLVRDYIGYGKLNPLLADSNIEDISVTSSDDAIWVKHSNYGDLQTNRKFGSEEELDKMARRIVENAGQGISKRQPTADVTLKDGSRVQVTYSNEVSEKGTNITIRRYQNVPFTPVDLINWETLSIDMVAYLWMAVQYGKKGIFAGGTASGKTTSLNAMSLFIPKSKIISIEDTPELSLPQEQWLQSVTRESGHHDDRYDYEEIDLMKEALRQSPDYMILGEVRDADAADALFQTINSGHVTFSTFHGDSVKGVIDRFTNQPMNIAPPQFSQLDFLILQEEATVNGNRVKRAKDITEITGYNDETGEVEINRTFVRDPMTDNYEQKNSPKILREIQRENGWSDDELSAQIQQRKVVLSYLIRNGIQRYAEVGGVVQAYMRDPDAVMHLIATNNLEHYLDNIANISSLDLSVDEEKERKLDRPDPDHTMETAEKILSENSDLIDSYLNYDLGDTFKAHSQEARNAYREQVEETQESLVDKAQSDAAENGSEDDGPEHAEVDEALGDLFDTSESESTTSALDTELSESADDQPSSVEEAEKEPVSPSPISEDGHLESNSTDGDQDTPADHPHQDSETDDFDSQEKASTDIDKTDPEHADSSDEITEEETNDPDNEDASGDEDGSSRSFFGKLFGRGSSDDPDEEDADSEWAEDADEANANPEATDETKPSGTNAGTEHSDGEASDDNRSQMNTGGPVEQLSENDSLFPVDDDDGQGADTDTARPTDVDAPWDPSTGNDPASDNDVDTVSESNDSPQETDTTTEEEEGPDQTDSATDNAPSDSNVSPPQSDDPVSTSSSKNTDDGSIPATDASAGEDEKDEDIQSIKESAADPFASDDGPKTSGDNPDDLDDNDSFDAPNQSESSSQQQGGSRWAETESDEQSLADNDKSVTEAVGNGNEPDSEGNTGSQPSLNSSNLASPHDSDSESLDTNHNDSDLGTVTDKPETDSSPADSTDDKRQDETTEDHLESNSLEDIPDEPVDGSIPSSVAGANPYEDSEPTTDDSDEQQKSEESPTTEENSAGEAENGTSSSGTSDEGSPETNSDGDVRDEVKDSHPATESDNGSDDSPTSPTTTRTGASEDGEIDKSQHQPRSEADSGNKVRVDATKTPTLSLMRLRGETPLDAGQASLITENFDTWGELLKFMKTGRPWTDLDGINAHAAKQIQPAESEIAETAAEIIKEAALAGEADD